MTDYEQIEFSVRNRLSQQEWLAQKATEILGEEETIRISHTPLTSRHFKDIINLMLVMMRSAFYYPPASFRALIHFFGLKKIKDVTELYDPNEPALERAFEAFNENKIPDQGTMVLPTTDCYDDYLVLSHIFAKNVRDRLNAERDCLIKIRWGLGHGIYNALVHGDPAGRINLRWKITTEEFQLQLTNAKNEERMKRHHVSHDGIPISGIGGSLVAMRLLFDYFNLSEVVNAKGEEEMRLTLIHRRNRKRFSLRYLLAVRVAQARDLIQLERILRRP